MSDEITTAMYAAEWDARLRGKGGFTQEDVDRLEAGGPELYGGLQGTAIEKEWWAFLDSVAARIAALLPPPPS